jgi:hypothetical protein
VRGDDVSLAVTLDEVCEQILRAGYEGRTLNTMHVNPAVFRDILETKARELSMGNPPMLLGLDVVEDELVRTLRPRVE